MLILSRLKIEGAEAISKQKETPTL